MTFRRAEPHDTEVAQLVYRRIVDHLAQTVEYTHWHTVDHPRPEQVRGWVKAGELYFAVANTGSARLIPEDIAGVVALNHDAPEAYRQAAWAVDATGDQVQVVHALGVEPDHLRRGVARHLLDCIITTGRDRGLRAVRLDTHVENAPARELYDRYGFTDLGPHELDYAGIELNRFHLFEYVL